mgnify:CR=1 FL=1
MMNVYIPIADVTLTDGQTYDGQLPVWATRPLMVKVTTGANEPVNIAVRNSGSSVKTVTLPYQQYGMDVDLSFAAPLLKRADRNESQGTPWFMPQELAFWTSSSTGTIIIPVFHCDLTYWDTLGVDAALPQPTKPRIPGQTLDIFFPYIIHPSDALFIQVEPVTGAPSNVIFPATYVLGDTIDITYIKKWTIKNVWGNGLDQVINYEDRLMSDVVYDTGLQCALRARWNMRNGQWFWDAFKDYFWSNKFTPIRGRGGVTEQAELTINLEYGEEWYNVYQELLVSSNIVFDLNIPGINQYQSKRFRAEVSGDTGARWSNSTKTYRQQVRFRTTELQDNYISPQQPDQPPAPSIVFSAQRNPWTIWAAPAKGITNSIYSNAAWEVQSTPSWVSADSPTGIAGTTPLVITVTANTGEARSGNIVLKSLVGSATYTIPITQQKASIVFSPEPTIVSAEANPSILLKQMNSTTSWQCVEYPTWAVPINLTGGAELSINCNFNLQANTGAPRSANITYRSTVNPSVQNSFSVTQAGTTGNITASPSTFNVDYLTHPVTINLTSFGNWSAQEHDPWITPSVLEGWSGTTAVTLTIGDNLPAGAPARTGTIRFYDHIAREFVTVTINQGGAPTSIKILPSRVSGPKAGGGNIVPAVATSENNWTMGSAPSWVAVSPTSGSVGQTAVAVKYDTANPGAARTGQLRIENMTTHEIAICLITQEG